jgi:aconitate hydratase
MANSFGSRSTLEVGKRKLEIHKLSALDKAGLSPQRLPFSLRILLENLLRHEDGKQVKEADIRAIADWDPKAAPASEIAFMPARVLLQDFTGVPAVVDLAAMRAAMKLLGGDPTRINPLLPAALVIDHSVQVDEYGRADALSLNAQIEFSRKERYAFLRGQAAPQLRGRPARHRHRPPGEPGVSGASFTAESRTLPQAYPDTLVGTDSHDDGQRPGRAGLGRGRHRGGGGDARAAAVDADPAGGRLPAARQAA